MAIATAKQRRAAAGMSFLPWALGVTPNSDKDNAWRRAVAGIYFVSVGPRRISRGIETAISPAAGIDTLVTGTRGITSSVGPAQSITEGS